MPSTNATHLTEENQKYASTFTQGSLNAPPSQKYTIVTCMDARIDTAAAFGIHLGDAHIIRNAGGSAKDALRSLIISEQLLGTNEILIVKHTQCGMVTFTNEQAYEIVEKNLGHEARAELDELHFDFLPFPQTEQAVKDDVQYLRSSKLIPDHIDISGWVYEVETGKVRPVD